jgi:hypothetical protein
MFQGRRADLSKRPTPPFPPRRRCSRHNAPRMNSKLRAGRHSGPPTNTPYGTPVIATSWAEVRPVRLRRNVSSRYP